MKIGDAAIITDHLNSTNKPLEGGNNDCFIFILSGCIWWEVHSKQKCQEHIFALWYLWQRDDLNCKGYLLRIRTTSSWRTLLLLCTAQLWKQSWHLNNAWSRSCNCWGQHTSWINSLLLHRYAENCFFYSNITFCRNE